MVKKSSALKDELVQKRGPSQTAARRKASITFRKAAFLEAAYEGRNKQVEAMVRSGIPVDTIDKITGMTALHLAVGRNNLELARFLVERGVPFVPDKLGRMPTTLAAECEVSEELCDFIVEAEATALAKGV
jgi:ankyrin repeat protein